MAASIPFDRRRAAKALKRTLVMQVGLQVSPQQDRSIQMWLEAALFAAYERGVRDGTGQ